MISGKAVLPFHKIVRLIHYEEVKKAVAVQP